MNNPRPVPWPWSAHFDASKAFPPSISELPVLVKDLVGRPCRIIRPDSVVTNDWEPTRVNIFLDANDRIIDIRFG